MSRKPAIAEILLGVIAIGAALAFGAVHSLVVSVVQLAILSLAFLVFWTEGWPRVPYTVPVVLAVLLGIPLLQLIPLPGSVHSLVSAGRVPLQDQVLGLVQQHPGLRPISVNPHATGVALLKVGSYALVFLMGFWIQRIQGSRFLVFLLMVLGLLEAVYGIVQYLTGWQYIFTYAKRYNIDSATGTYINRNHYAGLLEMILPFVFARVWFRVPFKTSTDRGILRGLFISPITGEWATRILFFAVLFIGLVFSKSRMGIAAALVGLVLVMGVAFLQYGRRSALAVALVVIALPLVYSVWIGLAPVLERFEVLGHAGALEEDRLPIWRDTLALIRDYPLLGTGLGTYHWASLHYQRQKFDLRYDHAHNDYLEFAADVGVPATVVLFGSLWLLVVQAARRALAPGRTDQRILAAGCAGAMASLLTHSLTDFNLQIPANALLFAWIAGTACALAAGRSEALARAEFEKR